MLRILGHLLICICVCVSITACVKRGDLIPYPKMDVLLISRSNEFYELLIQKKYEHVFEMLSEKTRAETDKEEYIASLKESFENFELRALPSEIVWGITTNRVTKTILLLEIESEYFNTCLQLEWTWEKENWYVLNDGEACISPSGEFKQ